MESQVQVDLQVLRAREVWLECLVFLDPRATEGSLDWMELKEIWVVLVKRERMELQVLWVLLAPWALWVPGEREEEMDLRDLQESGE